jgi:2-oxoglutarate dehydrogenase E2 component (dihydrolipoamide succinyltransferase)
MVLSPVVRRLINDHDLDPAAIQGSGIGGRITRADVERVIMDGSAGQAPAAPVEAAPAPAAPPSAPSAPSPAPEPPDTW